VRSTSRWTHPDREVLRLGGALRGRVPA